MTWMKRTLPLAVLLGLATACGSPTAPDFPGPEPKEEEDEDDTQGLLDATSLYRYLA